MRPGAGTTRSAGSLATLTLIAAAFLARPQMAAGQAGWTPPAADSAARVSSAALRAADPASLPGLSAPRPARETPGVGVHVLASAVVPGASQFLAGDDRWVPYLAAEVWGWVSYAQQRRTGDRLSRRYREVARQVARRISVGERRDTTWEYYEAMAHWPASGAWDRDPGAPGVQPEDQPGTYNGQIWALARGLYTPGGQVDETTPGYGQALAYYLRRAIRPEFAWAWGVSQLEQQEYVALIESSDAAYRSARDYLGLLLVNHVASTVDAFVTARLRELGAEGASLETVPHHDGGEWRVRQEIRIRF